MKKFVEPEITVVKFNIEDVITASAGGNDDSFDDSNVGEPV